MAAGLHLWGLGLAGSVGGFAGLFAALAFVAVATAFLAPRRARRIAAGTLAAFAVLAIGAGIRFVHPDRTGLPWIEHPAARYVAGVHLQRPGVQSRLAAWEAGLEGFAARPVLGWGPENFEVVFGRFASGYGAVTKPHDQAHGKLVEVAATTGAAGVAAYLGLWALALLAVWRAARGMAAGERALALGVGGALAGTLAQGQFLFDTTAGSLQTILLLGFAAGLEARAFARSHRPRPPARLSARCAALFGGRRARIALGAAAVALAVAGLTVHQAIRAAADVGHLPARHGSWSAMAGGIEGFRPLANTWRWLLIGALGRHWPRLRGENGAGARDLLEWASREAAEVMRTEPRSWRIQQSLARLYRAAAATDPQYAASARRHLERARALAPNRAVFPVELRPPDGLASIRRDDGRHVLRWRWPEGVGYLAVAESRGDGSWRFVLHVYDPARTSFVLPEGRAPGESALPHQGLPVRPANAALWSSCGCPAAGGRERPGGRGGAAAVKRTEAASPCARDGEAVRRSGRPSGDPGMAPPDRGPGRIADDGRVSSRERYKRPFDRRADYVGACAGGSVVAGARGAQSRWRSVSRAAVPRSTARRGWDGTRRVFRMLKFRTMVEDAEERTGPVWAAWRDARSTAIGRVLRRYHLDELPQVVNVLRGEMSLVGPRPERPALAARIGRTVPGFESRLRVRPGIAGLAQWRGGHPVRARHKLRYDNLYIARMGPWLDLRLFAACVCTTLRPSSGRAARRALTVGRPGSDAWQEVSRVRDIETGP